MSRECAREFLRVRVNLDVSKSLRRCLRVDVIGDKEETVMLLWYERLPNHCFRCGHLGHATRECSVVSVQGEAGEMGELPFGAWLRATPPEKIWNRKSISWRGDAINDKNEGRIERMPSGEKGSRWTEIGRRIKGKEKIGDVGSSLNYKPSGPDDQNKDKNICAGPKNQSGANDGSERVKLTNLGEKSISRVLDDTNGRLTRENIRRRWKCQARGGIPPENKMSLVVDPIVPVICVKRLLGDGLEQDEDGEAERESMKTKS
ncbi:hypothetical protein Dsin_028888 [Dipteronia sinensis]|uniref:CCHC-type domain-containing protein n=1 Tax=Dipteronia sinensis TaxID=43782 RepID=A0AAE0DVZ2_9ROSI|nr:hypothetical protein Dsin_028888 [Dipteronia sinensis]